MQATYSEYNYKDSIARIDEILDSSDQEYKEEKGVPSRESLTYNNGYYVDVTVLFVDLRSSKSLADKHTKPVLAKIYRTYISETISVLRSEKTIRELYIEGDGIWAVFNTTTKEDVNRIFTVAACLNTSLKLINKRLTRKGYANIKAGIGIDDGDSLYIKAGYKGSGISEVVWIGKVVGEAANLCSNGNRGFAKAIQVSNRVYGCLDDHNKSLLSPSHSRGCWEGDVIIAAMNDWVEKNA